MISRTDKNAMAQYVKVVEAGSFSGAARKLGRVQAAVSQ